MCERFAAGLVTEVMEGSLDCSSRPPVLTHLRVCEACAALLSRMRSVALLVAEAARHSGTDTDGDRAVLAACLPVLAVRRRRASPE